MEAGVSCGCLETFADLLSSLVLVKASLGAHLGPSPVYPAPEEAVTNCGFCELQTGFLEPITGSI